MAPRLSSPAERQRLIVLATMDDDVSAEELSRRFSVSLSTIRRDLQQLEAEGKLARTYGGGTRPRTGMELPAAEKDHRFQTQKDAIAIRATMYIEPEDVCFLDAGTTVGRLAAHLRGHSPLTIVTPGINAFMALHDDNDIELILAGGRLRHVNQGLLGPLAEQCFEQITGDKVFLGAEAIDPLRGISCPTMEQARLKTLMIRSAREVYVLADESKLEAEGFPYWSALPAGARLITTAASNEFIERFNNAGGVVEIVEDSVLGSPGAESGLERSA
jgi:DeoR family transcriptional regulator, fructose operon transcriptional repressor